ncbi:amidohydrolase [Fusibacter sp. JL298sf-3]
MKKVFFNGDIITVDDNQKTAEAVLIEDGIIIEVGLKKEVFEHVDEETEQVDLGGRVLMPGFIDPHSHFNMVGLIATMVDISQPPVGDVTSIDQLVERLKEAEAQSVLVAFGYDHNLLDERRHPNKFDLDKVSTTIPVIAIHTSLHVCSVNSKALEVFGYTSETPEIPGGKIERIQGTMEPTGYLEEMAFQRALMKVVEIDEEMMRQMLLNGQEIYIKNGITAAQDGALSGANYEFYKLAEAENLLKIDVFGYPLIIEDQRFYSGELPEKIGDAIGRLKLAGSKIVLDGSPQARTAYMSAPYEVVEPSDDPSYCAYPIYKDDQVVVDALVKSIQNGYQCLTHCNGDASLDQFLRCYDKALKIAQPKEELRLQIIHCQTAREDQLDALKKRDVYPSFFASHVFYWGDAHRANFGEARASKISNQAYALKIGLKFTDHEDSPVVPPMPFRSIWACVNRKTRSGHILGEGIPVMEALKAHTVNAAYMYFEEDRRGCIKVGHLADFIIVDQNILKIDPMKIADTQVLETIKEGVTLYKKW